MKWAWKNVNCDIPEPPDEYNIYFIILVVALIRFKEVRSVAHLTS